MKSNSAAKVVGGFKLNIYKKSSNRIIQGKSNYALGGSIITEEIIHQGLTGNEISVK